VSCSLYRMRDLNGRLLYVGITGVGPTRFSAHRHDKAWWHLVSSIDIEHFASRAEAVLAEQVAIREEKPRYNITYNVVRPQPEPLPGTCRWCGGEVKNVDRFEGHCSFRHFAKTMLRERVS
jgi:hypothetical protein